MNFSFTHYKIYSEVKEMYLIINADDFGYSKAVTDGIAYAFHNGIVTSTSAMCNMPAIEYAGKVIQECDGLGLGIHLTLTAGDPILKTHKTIVDESGHFFTRGSALRENIDIEEIYAEYEAQVQRFVEVFGYMPDHVDMHHNVNEIPEVWNSARRIAEKYGLEMRRCVENVTYFSGFYRDDANVEHFKEEMDKFLEQGIYGVEMGCHPGFVDLYLYKHSSYNIQRLHEAEVLTDPVLQEYIKEKKIQLTNYSKIKKG